VPPNEGYGRFMNIYVGNLPYSVRDADLRTAFERFGTVEEAEVIIDRRSNRSRGYGFVRMPVEAEARAAIEALDGTDFKGRQIRVDESRPREADARRHGGERPARAAARRPAATPARTSTQGSGLGGFLRRLFGRRS